MRITRGGILDGGALPAGSNELGSVRITDGADVALVDSSGNLNVVGVVDLGSNNDVTVDGSVAHDSPDSGGGGPVKTGGRAQAMFAVAEQASADNDRVDGLYDRNGYLRTRGELFPQSAVISDALSGDNEIIGTPGANKRIAVYGYTMISDGTVLARWETAAGGTALTGRMSFQAREGVSVSPGSMPLFVCSANQALNLELSAAVAMQGHVTYAIWDDA